MDSGYCQWFPDCLVLLAKARLENHPLIWSIILIYNTNIPVQKVESLPTVVLPVKSNKSLAGNERFLKKYIRNT